MIIIAVYFVVLLLYTWHNIIPKSENYESIISKMVNNEPIEFIYELPYMQQYDITSEKIKELNKMEEKYSYTGNITKLCSKYGYNSYSSKDYYIPKLFYGVIFNHELDILQMALYEMIDVIYSFSIIEANSTFTGIPRKLKFPELHERLNSYYSPLNIKLNSKLTYAPWLQVNNNSYLSSLDTPLPNHAGYGREENIRNSILESWKKLGMSAKDVGIISDSDEFISEEFLHAIKNCDIFSDFKKNLKNLGLKDNCKRSKILSRSYIFSSNLDCPQRAQYGNRTDIFAGIRMNWHPDLIIGKCLLDDSSNTTVENVRTRPGSNRLTENFVGWHYRNIMTPEEVLYKYSTCKKNDLLFLQLQSHKIFCIDAHPEESPLVMRYNLSKSDPLSAKIDHVLREKYDDCKYRSKILHESKFSTHNLPKLLQSPDGARLFKHLFHDMEEFYRIITL